jgi:H/ACA ribonucleoprotein complex subunit 2
MVCPDSKVKSKKTAAGSAAEEKEDDYREIYNECCSEVQKLDSAIVF